MNSFLPGALALLLALSGCASMSRPHPATAPEANRMKPIATLAPAPASPQADPVFFSNADLRVLSGGMREITEDGRASLLAYAPAAMPVPDAVETGSNVSPMMDLASLADWPGYRTERHLPPSLRLTIIDINEIRAAVLADLDRY